MRRATKIGLTVAALAIACAAAGWALTSPNRLSAEELAALPEGNAAAGERIFWAGGCASCHAAPQASGEAMLQLAGGVELESAFGTFVAPNISSDPDHGIGGWTASDFANAVRRGVAPDGQHYYPAFPYTSYSRMSDRDVADLFAFMQTLPAAASDAPAHRVSFPFTVRRGIGLWKRLYLNEQPQVALSGASEEAVRGQYLVEALGHCGECHTPRAVTGGLETDRWLGGRPNITPAGDIANWSETDIAYYLESGFTPDFDSAGGRMAAVVRNMARLPAEDREAIAAYLKAVPPVESQAESEEAAD
ncbi:cytochrome c [Aliihoeflea sp. 40Bstr573]|uniref:c-type cytochrome n=1 Tax=Aliihoeflea sp. 40Bstr573 TaxID=2696467 RepID=UPI0020960A25|nr:cytochrome c [Aliihoeflea sp. 40Bstr573]MCO6386026.1 c-type cytochrome [Aliihoeflea sp. 40Bstr573]